MKTLIFIQIIITVVYHFSIYPSTRFAQYMEKITGSYSGALAVTCVLSFNFIFTFFFYLFTEIL